MPVKSEQYSKVCVLRIEGDFCGDDVVAAKRVAQEAIDTQQIAQLVLDLEKSGFADSEGLEALLWLKRQCEDRFGQLKLASLDENMRKILELTRLEHRFECHADLPSALKTMR